MRNAENGKPVKQVQFSFRCDPLYREWVKSQAKQSKQSLTKFSINALNYYARQIREGKIKP